MAVQRCSCTSSALEIFIQDIAGVATRGSSRPNLSSARQHSIRARELCNTDGADRVRRPTASTRSTSGLVGRHASPPTKFLHTRRPIPRNLSTASFNQEYSRSYSTAKTKLNDEEGDIVAQLLADAEAGKKWNEQPKNTANTENRQKGLRSEPGEQKRETRGRHSDEKHDRLVRRDSDKDKRDRGAKMLKEGRTASQKKDAKAKPMKEATEEKAKPEWMRWKEAMKKKLNGQSWNPRKRVSPDSMNGIRALHAADPETYNLVVLGEHLKMSTEAVRRILRSKWQPTEKEAEARRIRWEKRGEKNRAEIAALDEKKLLAAAIRREKAAEATKQVRDRFDAMRRSSQVDDRPAVSREGW